MDKPRFSSLKLLNYLQKNPHVTCENCGRFLGTWFHCSVCNGYSICVFCYQKEVHSHHKLQKNDRTLGEFRMPQFISRCMQVLMHAWFCKRTTCAARSCKLMKEMIAHTRQPCQKSICKVCSRFLIICYFHNQNCDLILNCFVCNLFYEECSNHEKYCKSSKCVLSLCPLIKESVSKQRRELEQVSLLAAVPGPIGRAHEFRRRMTVMNTRSIPLDNSLLTALSFGEKSGAPEPTYYIEIKENMLEGLLFQNESILDILYIPGSVGLQSFVPGLSHVNSPPVVRPISVSTGNQSSSDNIRNEANLVSESSETNFSTISQENGNLFISEQEQLEQETDNLETAMTEEEEQLPLKPKIENEF